MDCSKPQGKIAFAIIKNSKTKGIPGGDLLVAFNKLKAKFEPNTTPQLMQLTKEFHSKALIKNQYPEIFLLNWRLCESRWRIWAIQLLNRQWKFIS
jgi:hypothetical protein